MTRAQIIACVMAPALYMGVVNLINNLASQRRNRDGES